jgi:acylpyruvate hydrolase
VQSSSTDQLVFGPVDLIVYLSQIVTLNPGDVIATGTPGGVGFARTPPVWMHPGDVIEISVEGLGTIRNRVVAEEDAPQDWRWRPGAPLKTGF